MNVEAILPDCSYGGRSRITCRRRPIPLTTVRAQHIVCGDTGPFIRCAGEEVLSLADIKAFIYLDCLWLVA